MPLPRCAQVRHRSRIVSLVGAVKQHLATARATHADQHRFAATSEHSVPDCILQAIWDHLDPQLQNAFSVAYANKIRRGSHRISTKDFFQALRGLEGDTIAILLDGLPESALSDPAFAAGHSPGTSVDETVLLSDCVSDSLHRFGRLRSIPRKLTSADVFVDIAKRGHGPSVARLREYGVGQREIDAAVERLNLRVVNPC
jgi:hypothetical protein